MAPKRAKPRSPVTVRSQHFLEQHMVHCLLCSIVLWFSCVVFFLQVPEGLYKHQSLKEGRTFSCEIVALVSWGNRELPKPLGVIKLIILSTHLCFTENRLFFGILQIFSVCISLHSFLIAFGPMQFVKKDIMYLLRFLSSVVDATYLNETDWFKLKPVIYH